MSNRQGAFGGSQRRKMRQSSKNSGNAIPLPLQPLNPGHRMDPYERVFLEAAEKGDKPTMVRCLQQPHSVNVNCTNILGRSAIQIAVDNENIEIVELLLKQENIKIGDALLYAIHEGVYRIVEMLIDHPSITREMLGADWAKTKLPGEESSDYSPDISPIILAAHCNQFEILQLLLSRGAKIDRPHQLSCSCKKCREQTNEDGLRHSLLRIHTYRALASPAWISLTSSDPVLTAFKLSWELERLASRENEFKDIYVELTDQCKKYACDLLDQCRSSEEVIAVLNKESDSDDEDDREDEDSDVLCEKITLARLKLAVKYEQKRFVAHPHCQQLLSSVWFDGLPGWRSSVLMTKIFICFGFTLLMPFMGVCYLIVPRSRIGSLMRSPFMKFMSHSTSFAIFLILLVMASTNLTTEVQNRPQLRGPTPNTLEWVIFLYVIGFIWAECKQIWEEGLKAYIRQWWNWLDFIMLSLYLCTFSLRFAAYFCSLNPEKYGPNKMIRTDWPEDDPTLISEGVFAVANVFSFARIIFLFVANPQLGPLQISLGCMLIDIAKFMFIFFLVLTSFACGLNQLYWYYADESINARKSGDEFANIPFTTIDSSFSTLFWSLFGLISVQLLHINKTRIVGFAKCLFGAYNIGGKVLMLNMLIAMMQKSFISIRDHADREWKFARSKLWMGYFDEGCTLPPPLNLIISPKSLYYILRGIKRLICRSSGKEKRSIRKKSLEAVKDNKSYVYLQLGEANVAVVGYTNNHIHGGLHITDQTANGTERPHHNGEASSLSSSKLDILKYQDVMRRLVSRYIHQTKKQLRQDGVNEDDLLEIKQDISSLRFELREDRKKESSRTSTHIENMKRDILRQMKGTSYGAASSDSPVPNHIMPTAKPMQGSVSPTMPHSVSGNILSQQELESLKREIVSGLKNEIREIAQEMIQMGQNVNGSPAHPPSLLPPINSELYHTHLYTQL